MGKHTRPEPPRECAYGMHYGPTNRRASLTGEDVMWFCGNCGNCTGVSHMTRRTETGTLLALVPETTG